MSVESIGSKMKKHNLEILNQAFRYHLMGKLFKCFIGMSIFGICKKRCSFQQLLMTDEPFQICFVDLFNDLMIH